MLNKLITVGIVLTLVVGALLTWLGFAALWIGVLLGIGWLINPAESPTLLSSILELYS